MNTCRVPILILCLALVTAAQPAGKGGKRNKGKNAGRNNWNQSEYSGTRTAKDVSMAMYSKGFAWLSGSPADNEKLSVGKTAQFFGFVAVRYASGRVAQRGELGRAFHDLATPAHCEVEAVVAPEFVREQNSIAGFHKKITHQTGG